MSDESGGKKSAGGHIAVALAGIGALFARTVDDCGRVAIKGGAAMSDDALRCAGRVGSLADDGLRGGAKLGTAADDGLRAGKVGIVADDGLRNGVHWAPPHGEKPGFLIEEAGNVGTKAESHAADAAEFGVDVSLEVISNVPTGDDADDAPVGPSVSNEPSVTAANPQFDTMSLLRARMHVSQPALLPVMPASPKAFHTVLGRPDKPGEGKAFVGLKPTPSDGQPVLDPLKWIKGRISHNPITFVFYTTKQSAEKTSIPLVLPNGETTDDSTLHRACIEHFSHCVVLVCNPEKAGYKQPCAKSAVDAWQTVAADSSITQLPQFLEKMVAKRAETAALHGVTISRVDLSMGTPRIVRSRLKAKTP
ncbi:MAG TPA: hypothetical protein PK156_09015 [Polyangium sp.]|nr:hypothetical protein [Polyangium sp.]